MIIFLMSPLPNRLLFVYVKEKKADTKASQSDSSNFFL
jgi:hypothetical protein